MFARIRSILFSINASYWFYPALFATFAFVMATAMVELDRAGAADWLSSVSVLHPARPDGASNMLTVLAGSMIGVASTVFSITIAAVAYASGTYGPRLLTNFMEDKGNQLSLATFIGTFVYAITVLRTVRSEQEAPLVITGGDAMPGFVPQLALLTGFVLMIVSVGVLVYFLHHIPSSIRINTVLEGIGKDLLGRIEDRFEEAGSGPPTRREPCEGATIGASNTGYIRYIDFGTLSQCARDAGADMDLLVRPGDFLQPGKAMARLSRSGIEDAMPDKVRACFALGGSRTPEQDLEFSIDELVEIALRALSPGINDPFTAITALHWLGAATAALGRKELSPVLSANEPGEPCVQPLDDDFGHFVKRGFGAVRPAVASNKLAALVALDSLDEAARQIDDASRKAQLRTEADLLLAQAEHALTGPELDEVRARYHALAAMAGG